MSDSMMALLAALNTHHVNAQVGTRHILNDVTISCPPGQFTVIAGPNGAGKTTLLKVLAGIITPVSGNIHLNEQPLKSLRPLVRAKKISYLPQQGILSWPLSVRHVVALGRLPFGETPERLSVEGKKAVDEAIEQVGLKEFEERIANALSGGERARVLLARALATRANVLLADEPVAALDPLHQYLVLDVLRQQAHTGAAVVAVMHDLNLTLRFADQVILLKNGSVFSTGSPLDVLTPASLAECFGIQTELVTTGDTTSLLIQGPVCNSG